MGQRTATRCSSHACGHIVTRQEVGDLRYGSASELSCQAFEIRIDTGVLYRTSTVSL